MHRSDRMPLAISKHSSRCVSSLVLLLISPAISPLSPPVVHPGGELFADAGLHQASSADQVEAGSLEASYYDVRLRRPGVFSGPGLGRVKVVFPASPFGVAVTPDGNYVYDLHISGERLPPTRGFFYIVWLASSDLRIVKKVGKLEGGETLRAMVDFDNKFVVFVSVEASVDVVEPQGRIIVRAMSRSSGMHGMFSHGFCPPDAAC